MRKIWYNSIAHNWHKKIVRQQLLYSAILGVFNLYLTVLAGAWSASGASVMLSTFHHIHVLVALLVCTRNQPDLLQASLPTFSLLTVLHTWQRSGSQSTAGQLHFWSTHCYVTLLWTFLPLELGVCLSVHTMYCDKTDVRSRQVNQHWITRPTWFNMWAWLPVQNLLHAITLHLHPPPSLISWLCPWVQCKSG